MFRGLNELTLDDKGRLAMPSRHRDTLNLETQGQLVVTIDTECPCLLIYPVTEWEKIEKKITQLPSFNPITRRIQRLLIGHATEVSLDTHGRFLIPPPLRVFAQLSKDVILIGQGQKFELWDGKVWQNSRVQWLEAKYDLNNLPDELKTLAL
ncbi:MAG: division/cell wall cluster transcriptional repressor MraZ [Gammaproteobacteria bacterium]